MHAATGTGHRGRPASTPAPTPAPTPASTQAGGWTAAWARLHAHLQARAAELNAEVRHYPGPIARCDDQLPKLLEQRSHALSLLKRLNEAAPAGAPDAGATRLVLAECGATDDDTERDLRAALGKALDAVRRSARGCGRGERA